MSDSGGGKKRRWGCIGCLGCLGLMAVLAAAVVAVIIFAPDLLRKVGLRGADPEKVFSGAADPVGTQMVTEMLETAGFQGVQAVVLPVEGGQGQVAVITVDQDAVLGYSGSGASGEEQFITLMQDFARANQEAGLQIEAVAFDFEGEGGESLVSVAMPQAAVEAYAAGEISRREFLGQVEIDFTNLISLSELQSLMQEYGGGQ